MLDTTDDDRRLFQRLEQDGALARILEIIRQESVSTENVLRAKLRADLLHQPELLAEFNALQGRLSGFARLLTVFRELGTRPPG